MSAHEMTQASITCAGCHHAYEQSALFCPNCGTPKVRSQTSDALVGKLLGERFQVQELIGQGGSGTIYRAEHVTLRRRVAIKVLHDELSRDELAVERFRREATTVAEIDNEHIVEIHDFGRTPDGRLYLAMELLEGETLDAVLARDKQLSIERAADILIQVGEALMEAHAIGYVHRDLRPRNLYLAVRRGKANFVKLLDFGLSKLVESDAQAASTSLGMTFGDPRYMSPEQARGDRIDRRADIYQLGCVAYEMLTGAPPFTGNRVFDILSKQVTDIPAPLPTLRKGVPLWMEAAVAKMLAKDPENRFATTTRMVEALRRGLETGEIMEDEIARRRESIPPPSVSRVMQRMGIPAPVDERSESAGGGGHAGSAGGAGGSAPRGIDERSASKPVDGKQTMTGQAPAPGSFEQPGERRRTGTPQIGVPIMPAPVAPPVMAAGPAAVAPVAPPRAAPVAQPAVSGQIEPSAARGAEPAFVSAPPEAPRVTDSAPLGRAGRGSAQGALTDSAVWFSDGDRASEEAEDEPSARARKLISPSTTDLSLYDEPPTRSRWPLVIGVVGVGLAIGAIVVALTRGDKPAPSASAQRAPAVMAPAPVDPGPGEAEPSEVIPEDPAPVAKPIETAPPVTVAKDVTPATAKPAKPAGTAKRTPDSGASGSFVLGGRGDTAARRPGGDLFGPAPTPVTVPAPVITPTPTPRPTPTGVSGVEGPVDPYGNPDAPDGSAPDKKAEFYANLGQQQLGSGDTAGAAASFKKAIELDARNVAAVTGMGEIALRQGLFGDAIAHLRRAARLAPRSSRVFTLLGEAYLSSGQNAIAAENFKKALQLDPDNTRAREGYNEASSRVPPPEDDF
jgi:eukaryotic-like serine/threonine-protein kinase